MFNDEETLDCLGADGLRIIQPRTGFRFGLDPVLLASFTKIGTGERVVDLGTGNGVIPLLLCRQQPSASFLGIEIDAAAADRARRSVLLNGLQKQIEILHADIRHVRQQSDCQSADVVVANPPYRRPGTGRLAATSDRATARHELHGTLAEFIETARFMLKNKGRFHAIFLPERLPELLSLMSSRRIEPKRLRCVHSRATESACLVLVEGRRDGRPGLTIEPPLTIYAQEGKYTTEVRRMAGYHD